MVRGFLLHAHVNAQAQATPPDALVTFALLGRPLAAMRQAAQDSDPAEAAGVMHEILAALVQHERLPGAAVDFAVGWVGTIPEVTTRMWALAGIAGALAPQDRDRALELVRRAQQLHERLADQEGDERLVWLRSWALAGIVKALTLLGPDEAEEVALTIPSLVTRCRALAGIARALAPPRSQPCFGARPHGPPDWREPWRIQ